MLNARGANICALLAPDYEVDQSVLLFFGTMAAAKSEDRGESVRLLIRVIATRRLT